MKMSNSFMKLLSVITIIGIVFFTDTMAQKIIWVSSNYLDLDSLPTDHRFVDLLEANGYDVQVEIDSMKGIPLSAEQIDILESADLIIFSRATSSGDYSDPDGWNSITKPLILQNVWAARASKWQWAVSEDLVNSGDSKDPMFYNEDPGHAIYTGVNINADGTVEVLDTTVGSGNTSILNSADFGDGELIASLASTFTEAIVYWPEGSVFNSNATYNAGGPRLLFSCGTREGTSSRDGISYGVGIYNLTPDGEKMYLNAVAFMLGKPVGVSEKTGAVPAGYTLKQNYPNPFNPSTRITFTLPATSVTKISVYNLLSQEIAVLAEGTFQAGTHEVTWNGCDRFGNHMPSGVYLYQMKTGDRTQARKMLLLK
jgi:hypothetical protein